MSFNTYGRLFRVTSWGESHGPAIGCVIDGCPSGVPLEEKDIQIYLDQRRPGKNPFVSPRQEKDQVNILSGLYREKENAPAYTTGTPISLMIENTNQRSRDYTALQHVYRPGHADFTYEKKYAIRDPRGGGRASARETATRVAAGAIARKVLGAHIKIRAAVVQIGPLAINRENWVWENCTRNPFFCPDDEMVPKWEAYLKEIRRQKSAVGALVEVVAEGVPAGWGAPVYGKLDADLAAGLMSINAAKGVEIGAGFACVEQTGEQAVDEMCSQEYLRKMQKENQKIPPLEPHPPIGENKKTNTQETKNNPVFLGNQNGGVLGGISTGQNIIARVAFKPTSSIPQTRKTIDHDGKDTVITVTGRHDPCVGLRAPPILEAVMACILLDHKLYQRAQNRQEHALREGA